jgi:hypothetical protein
VNAAAASARSGSCRRRNRTVVLSLGVGGIVEGIDGGVRVPHSNCDGGGREKREESDERWCAFFN